jgi:hypothetical protein
MAGRTGALRQADQASTDFAAIPESEIAVIQKQLARLPTRGS